MVSFSSSAVNKSGKKFAPKAPVRRAPPAPKPAPVAAPAPSQARPNAVQPGNVSRPSQPASTSTTISPEPPTPAIESSSAVPAEIQVAELDSQKKNQVRTATATAIQIPRPKRKASVSAPTPAAEVPIATPQPTPPHRDTPTTAEPSPVHPESQEPGESSSHVREEISQDLENRKKSATPAARRRLSEGATEIRPPKRVKTAAKAPAVANASQVLTPPPTQPQTSEVEETTETPDETTSQATEDDRKKAKVRGGKRKRSGDSENGAAPRRAKKPRPRKQREPTPEDAQDVEITPTVVKMSDLCKDLRTGKLSKRETELRNMDLAEVERKQKAQQDGEDNEQTRQTPIKENGEAPSPAPAQTENSETKKQAGPVMRIVNGEIVLDAESLQVDRHADAEKNVGELEDVVENSLTRRINQTTYGKRTKAESWDEDTTDLFYRGLRMFGTDFMMISKLFPNRSRHQIKLKFNNEERRRPEKIKRTLLGPGEAIDIETYSEMTNTVYDDPRAVQQELDEDKKRIEDQHAKEKEAQEELLRNPSGTGDNAPNGDADAPVKGKARNNKKQIAKNMGGGTEEVIGSIDD